MPNTDWLFPLPARPKESYKAHPRNFGTSRDGRLHAGVDLYAPVGTIVRAVADGVVISISSFYWQTDQVTVDHGGYIVRYGEVAPNSPNRCNIKVGSKVARGQKLAEVGRLIPPNKPPFPHSMLHFELYNSSESIHAYPLTSPKGKNGKRITGPKYNSKYQRRIDITNPTERLDNAKNF